MTDLPDHTPLALSDENIAPFYGRDPETGARIPDDDLDALGAAMRQAGGQADQILALSRALRADGTVNRDAMALTLRQKGLQAGQTAAGALDRARDRLSAVVSRLEAETAAPPVTHDAGGLMLEGEVRGALARMGAKERTAAIAEAFEAGDDAVVGAVLRGPALLSGLSTDERGMLQVRYRKARHPLEFDRIERLSKALAGLEQAGVALVAFTDAITTAPKALEAEQAAHRTEQALASFN